jgi:hypothetical protein
MAVLTDPQRAAVWKAFMDAISSRNEEIGSVTKQEIRTAVDATDQYMSDEEAAYGTVLSSNYKLATTKTLRSELYELVADARCKAGV